MRLQMDPDSNRHWLWMGLAYLVVDTKAQNIMKEPEYKIIHWFGWLIIIFSDLGIHFMAHNVQQGAERYPCQRNSLIWNWSRQLKHWLSKKWEDKNLKGWLTCLQECVLPLNMSMTRAKYIRFPPDIFVCFSGESGEGVRGRCWYTFFSIASQLFPPLYLMQLL